MPGKIGEGATPRKDFLEGLDENPFWNLEFDLPVKTDKIENLCKYLGRAKVEDLLVKFENEARERIATIALEYRDREAIKRQTHSLAGLAGSMGCIDLERKSRALYAEAETQEAPFASPEAGDELAKMLGDALPLLKTALASFHG